MIVTDHKEENKPLSIHQNQYGTMSLASSSTISTISPNDDNESLYLLWTHQLLKEKGYHLNEDEESIESSITQASSKTNWFRTCFPICY